MDKRLSSAGGVPANATSKGGLLFTSTISCLSWTTLDHVHWSGPALWYASIVLSLFAIVLGAQQVLITSGWKDLSLESTIEIKKLLTAKRVSKGRPQTPRKFFMFVSQAPMMVLGYAINLFLAGLISVVISPLASKGVWESEAKVRQFSNFWGKL